MKKFSILIALCVMALVAFQFAPTSAQDMVIFSDGSVGYTNCGPTGGGGGGGTGTFSTQRTPYYVPQQSYQTFQRPVMRYSVPAYSYAPQYVSQMQYRQPYFAPYRNYSYRGVPRYRTTYTYRSGPFGLFGRSSVSYGSN